MELEARFNSIVPTPVKQLGEVFDLEKAVDHLCKFKVQNGKLVIYRQDRIEWEADGNKEFCEFYEHVCAMEHVKSLADEDHTLALLPHDGHAILKKFKTTLRKVVWENLESKTDTMFFDDESKAIDEFQRSSLITLLAVDNVSLDKWFELCFASGVVVKARLCEENIIAAFYDNVDVYTALGRELCIALDVALAAGGCEAVVEGFYSMIGNHKKDGGLSNVLMQRAIVDWSLPNPLSCPKTLDEIGRLYTEGDKKLGTHSHRLPLFMDKRGQSSMKYNVSKVVDRLALESPKCPHIIKPALK